MIPSSHIFDTDHTDNLDRVNPHFRSQPEQKFFLHIAVLACGQYHHNIRSKVWNTCIASPLNRTFKGFWKDVPWT
ncbi:MAG: hypothetical protein GY906_24500 [bacterium]|nr:hypothetical protein [bacterium]